MPEKDDDASASLEAVAVTLVGVIEQAHGVAVAMPARDHEEQALQPEALEAAGEIS